MAVLSFPNTFPSRTYCLWPMSGKGEQKVNDRKQTLIGSYSYLLFSKVRTNSRTTGPWAQTCDDGETKNKTDLLGVTVHLL